MRWQHPERGLLPPAEFIPAAEASGAIVDIGNFVLRQACAQIKSWHDQWPDDRLLLSVNLSPRELAEPDLVTRIEQVLRDADLDPWFLVVELTESRVAGRPRPSGGAPAAAQGARHRLGPRRLRDGLLVAQPSPSSSR